MKYLGIILLVSSILVANILHDKISINQSIIIDYNNDESYICGSIMNYLRNICKSSHFKNLYHIEKIKNLYSKQHENNSPYGIEVRDSIIQFFEHHKVNYNSYQSNFSLLSSFMEFVKSKHRPDIENQEYKILISDINEIPQDSLELKISLFIDVKHQNEFNFEYQGKLIGKKKLNSFENDISDLIAIIKNPTTGEISLISGK